MNRATQITTSAMGVLAGLAGLEHGIGEVLQGDRIPGGVMIQSWPESESFQVLNGEPAMTLLPTLRIAGVVTILFALIFLVWATLLIQRPRAGLVLIVLSITLLLVGGGFGPPLLGLIVGTTATRIHAPLTWWRARFSPGVRSFLAMFWPWAFAACLTAWLYLFPGSILFAAFLGVNEPILLSVAVAIFAAFGLLLLTLVCAFARDLRRQPVAYRTPAGAW